MNNKELVAKLLEEQSAGSDRDNDVVIGKMRAVAGNLFKRYGVPEFDYQSELETLSHAFSDDENYRKAKKLVGLSVDFTGDDRVDRPLIIGAFALALGNVIRIGGDGNNPIIVQYVQKDFAAKSGISDFEIMDGLGGWVAVGNSSNYWDGHGKVNVEKQINLNRPSRANREEIPPGSEGIKRTAKKMKSLTLQYLQDDFFANDRKLLRNWAKDVLKRKDVTDRGDYMKAFADQLSDPNCVRYIKDPTFLRAGQIESREWLQIPSKTLNVGCADCDDLCLVISSLALMCGLGVTIRIAGCNPSRRTSYSHVYNLLHYNNENGTGGVDGFTGEKDVFVDVVYQKRLGRGKGYGIEPRRFIFFDTKVL